MSITFGLTVFAWIFFRAENIRHAFDYISIIFSKSIFSIPTIRPRDLILLIIIFNLIEWQGRTQQYAIAKLGLNWVWPLRLAMYFAILFAIFWFGGKEQQFIYFQF
ncbi:hypothetical protein FLGE108171_15845 [Flavobacterium gelidilacus]